MRNERKGTVVYDPYPYVNPYESEPASCEDDFGNEVYDGDEYYTLSDGRDIKCDEVGCTEDFIREFYPEDIHVMSLPEGAHVYDQDGNEMTNGTEYVVYNGEVVVLDCLDISLEEYDKGVECHTWTYDEDDYCPYDTIEERDMDRLDWVD